MARRVISEYRAKHLLSQALSIPYAGQEIITTPSLSGFTHPSLSKLVLKVDQGVKKRGLQGLVKTNLTPDRTYEWLEKWSALGYSSFLIEPHVMHDESEERYLSLERTGNGIRLLYIPAGGVNVESSEEKPRQHILSRSRLQDVSKDINIDHKILGSILNMFNDHHMCFLEINPFIVKDGEFIALDAAALVDDSALLLLSSDSWSEDDYRKHTKQRLSSEERAINQLANTSQASFTYELINPNGSIFMLLSGGGASVVLADEIYNLGYGNELANYGEYSGNPNQQETYLYASHIVAALLKSKAKQKTLVIAGGVANFTDIRATFKGIIQALNERSRELRDSRVKVHVRRGGPHEEEALREMEMFLRKNSFLGSIGGREALITQAATCAAKGLS